MPRFEVLKISGPLIALALLSASTVTRPRGQSTTAGRLSSAGQEKNPPGKLGTTPSEYSGLKLNQVKRHKGRRLLRFWKLCNIAQFWHFESV